MAEQPNSPPAFPSTCLGDPGHPASVPGMSLRDYLAGQALAGICANMLGKRGPSVSPEDFDGALAYGAYAVADAMLAEREKGGAK